MSLLLGLDFETTGLDPVADGVIEVGLVHWDTQFRQPVRLAGFLVKPDVEIPTDRWASVLPISGISRWAVEGRGQDSRTALKYVSSWLEPADAVVTFNGSEFDRLFYENWCDRAGIRKTDKLWVDTRMDLPEPRTGSLMLQAAQDGFVNPFPHRAVTDVLTLFKILDRYDITKVLERARIPNVLIAAKDLPFERKDEAKERGYFWDGEGRRMWCKRMKQCDVAAERAAVKFQVVVIEGEEPKEDWLG